MAFFIDAGIRERCQNFQLLQYIGRILILYKKFKDISEFAIFIVSFVNIQLSMYTELPETIKVCARSTKNYDLLSSTFFSQGHINCKFWHFSLFIKDKLKIAEEYCCAACIQTDHFSKRVAARLPLIQDPSISFYRCHPTKTLRCPVILILIPLPWNYRNDLRSL